MLSLTINQSIIASRSNVILHCACVTCALQGKLPGVEHNLREADRHDSAAQLTADHPGSGIRPIHGDALQEGHRGVQAPRPREEVHRA